jgi:hypothetical protein
VDLDMCTVQRNARVCDHFDHESANSSSPSWCVPYYADTRTDNLTRFAEARTASAVIVSPPPTLNMAASAVCSDGQTKGETKTSENLTGDLQWGSNYPPSKVDVEVHIDESIIGDSRQSDGEPIDRDHYATPRSQRDRAQDNQV